MRTNKKLITILSVLVLTLLTSIFCMSVFAEKAEEKEDAPETVSTVVSGCDLKKEDLQMAKVDIAGFSMLVPGGKFDTPETDINYFTEKNYYGNSQFGSGSFFHASTSSSNSCSVYAGAYEVSPLEKCYSDYSKLTDSQKELLIAELLGGGLEDSYKASFQKINGRTYLMISGSEKDESTGTNYVIYGLYSVIGNYKYIIQIQAINPDKNDLSVINEMLNSIKLTGIREPMSALEIVLLVCVILLLVAVGFAFFTLYRLDKFVKSGATDIKMFGLNLPEAVSTDEDSDDDDDDDDDDASDETVGVEKDEKIVDDE